MKLAALFWFYKEPEICKNRLEMLRYYNPQLAIYGLYGGDPSKIHEFDLLNPDLDDLYVYRENKPPQWKWLHGDQLIAAWYRERGRSLTWDTVVVVQWDMLLYGPFSDLFKNLRKDEVLFSGLRPIKEVEKKWIWVSPDFPEYSDEYRAFMDEVRTKYKYDQEPLGCLFIVACFPRIFLEKFTQADLTGLGFLEYKFPIYAQIFRTSFCTDHPYQPGWDAIESCTPGDITLSASGHELRWRAIERNALKPAGARVFHPWNRLAPINRKQLFAAVIKKVLKKLWKSKG